MNPRYRIAFPFLLTLFLVFGVTWQCSTGIEPSPEPSLLRITLQADPGDSTIIIADDTIYARPRDSMQITIFQGKTFMDGDGFVDSNYSVLFKDTLQSFTRDWDYNILKRNEDGEYRRYTIFESFVPPGEYDSLQFGIRARFVLLSYGYDEGGLEVPMETPPGTDPIIEIEEQFTMEEAKVTEINLRLRPFGSVTRYQDVFWFTPELWVEDVSMQGRFR